MSQRLRAAFGLKFDVARPSCDDIVPLQDYVQPDRRLTPDQG